jgi:hypothetical protein
MGRPSLLVAVLASAVYLANISCGHADRRLVLARPVNCELGKSCYIQNYVDHDSSEKALDYKCGHQTYDGHDGTDIRLPDLEVQKRGVEVLAAVAGKIKYVRDGMDDVSVRIAGRNLIVGRECGNGVLIDHEQGWTTQYCHLAKGSLQVTPGEQVIAGQILGLIGWSGDTEFPHLHFTVRHNQIVVDPFAYEAEQNSCNRGQPIWTPDLLNEMQYQTRQMLNFGFSDVPPTMDMIETGEIKQHVVSSNSDALVAYIRTIGLEMGDEQTLEIWEPSGRLLVQSRLPALQREKAQMFISAGKRLKGSRWPRGKYQATYIVTKNGIEVRRKTFEIQLSE